MGLFGWNNKEETESEEEQKEPQTDCIFQVNYDVDYEKSWICDLSQCGQECSKDKCPFYKNKI
jgi:hypothetical protein